MATLYHPTASQLNAHEGGISCVAWGHGLVVTGSADEAVHSYEVSGAKIERRHTLPGHELGVTAVAVAADVAVAASAALDSRIRVWNLDTGSLNLEIDCGPMSYGVALSPDGATVAAGSMGGISLWDAASGSKTASLSIGSDRIVLCAAISADGALLAAGAEDGGVHVFEMEARRGSAARTPPERHAAPPRRPPHRLPRHSAPRSPPKPHASALPTADRAASALPTADQTASAARPPPIASASAHSLRLRPRPPLTPPLTPPRLRPRLTAGAVPARRKDGGARGGGAMRRLFARRQDGAPTSTLTQAQTR